MLLFCCETCGKNFSLRNQTPLYRMKISDDKFYTIVRCVGEGTGVRGTARICEVDKDTVLRVVTRMGAHVENTFDHFLRDLWPKEVQLDDLWSFIVKKEKNLTEIERLHTEFGDCWIWVAFDPETKIVLGYVLGKRTKDNAIKLLQQVRNVMGEGCFPLFTSDELSCYKDALIEVFGVMHQPERKGTTGRFPKPRKVPDPRQKYAIVHKEREKNRIVKVERRIGMGDPKEIDRVIESSRFSKTINTSGVERENGKLRAGQGRLTRKTLGFSKKKEVMQASLSVYLGYDHFCRDHLGLRERMDPEPEDSPKRWVRRTPMMGLGVTDHCWSVKELVLFRSP
jgi:IS1 family transposase